MEQNDIQENVIIVASCL